MTIRRISALSAVLAGATMLAACSGGSDEPEAPENETVNETVLPDAAPVENFADPEPLPTVSATPTPVAEPARSATSSSIA